MSDLNPEKLHVRWMEISDQQSHTFPRAYTLTHSDRTGDLFLTIGPDIDRKQISGWYTRLMRDEVLAKWEKEGDGWSLHVHLHVSGGIVLGTARWRAAIFRQHLPGVLQAFRHGDPIFSRHPELDHAPIYVHFHAKQTKFNQTERWGRFEDFHLNHPTTDI